jgi:hypothetical protein
VDFLCPFLGIHPGVFGFIIDISNKSEVRRMDASGSNSAKPKGARDLRRTAIWQKFF